MIWSTVILFHNEQPPVLQCLTESPQSVLQSPPKNISVSPRNIYITMSHNDWYNVTQGILHFPTRNIPTRNISIWITVFHKNTSIPITISHISTGHRSQKKNHINVNWECSTRNSRGNCLIIIYWHYGSDTFVYTHITLICRSYQTT